MKKRHVACDVYFCIMSWTNSLSARGGVSIWGVVSGIVGGVHTVDPAITILVRLADHLIDLVVSELLTNGSHDVTELGSGNEAVVVAIEHLECLTDLLLGVGVLHLAGHHGQEF